MSGFVVDVDPAGSHRIRIAQQFEHELPDGSFDGTAQFPGSVSGIVDGAEGRFNHIGRESPDIDLMGNAV